MIKSFKDIIRESPLAKPIKENGNTFKVSPFQFSFKCLEAKLYLVRQIARFEFSGNGLHLIFQKQLLLF
jgi:hypothetical protein